MAEKTLYWFQKIHGISFAALRYFNACGASLDGVYGENHKPETHLIPNIINAIIEEKEFGLFGTDYQTPDGTCIRDYIHVLDLVEAHILALEKIINEPGGYAYNVGTGRGYSNREVMAAVEQVSGRKVKVSEKERRQGDANELVADVSKIKSELGFNPQYSDLNTIIESAWKYHNSKL
jgi:UDP-glucose 4-epimerase